MSSWWWCLTHSRVEEQDACAHSERLGPYDTREQAQGALAAVAERTARLDAEDEADERW